METIEKATMTAAPIPSANIQQNSEICKFAKPQLCDEFCERDVIAACLMYTNLFDGLTADLFHTPLCHNIFDISMQIIAAGNKPDIVSVAEFSSKHNMGITPQDLMSLTNNPTPDLTFGQNIKLLRLLAARRKMQTVAYLLDETATNKSLDIADTLEKAQEQLNEIAEAAQPKQDDYVIDLSVAYPEPHYTIELNGVGSIPCGDIQGVVAKQKQGKTQLCIVLCASLLGCTDFGFKSLVPGARILYADTEQSEANASKLAVKIHTLMCWPTDESNSRLRVVSLRRKAVKERLPIIVREVRKYKPTAVIVDGLVDLVTDFNDLRESADVIQSLMRLSAECDCAVVCVLHLNKSKDNNTPRGHVGSFLCQKASDVFQVEKSESGIFNVTETDCRNCPIDSFAFGLDGHGVPMKTQSIAEAKAEENAEQLAQLLRRAFGQTRELTYTELRKAIMMHGGLKERTAERRIKEATDKGLLAVTVNNDKYCLP